MPAHQFIDRWQNSGAAEVPRPNPAVGGNGQNNYVFEHPVTFRHPTGLTSTGFIDLYKRGCFVLEAKQGSTAPEPSLLFEVPHRRGTAILETLSLLGQAKQEGMKYHA